MVLGEFIYSSFTEEIFTEHLPLGRYCARPWGYLRKKPKKQKTSKISSLLVLEERRLGTSYWIAGEDYSFHAVRRQL